MNPTRCLAALGLTLALAPPADASAFRAARNYSATGISSVRLDFPAGSLRVEGGEPGGEFEAVMTARCRRDHGKCEERAQRIKLVSETEGNTRTFRMMGMRKLDSIGLEVDLVLRVPPGVDLEIDMGAGELEVADLASHVDVHLGAGEVDLQLSEADVASVDVRVGIGEAALRSSGRRLSGSGFLSKRINWNGSGRSHVEVDLGVGDVGVALE